MTGVGPIVDDEQELLRRFQEAHPDMEVIKPVVSTNALDPEGVEDITIIPNVNDLQIKNKDPYWGWGTDLMRRGLAPMWDKAQETGGILGLVPANENTGENPFLKGNPQLSYWDPRNTQGVVPDALNLGTKAGAMWLASQPASMVARGLGIGADALSSFPLWQRATAAFSENMAGAGAYNALEAGSRALEGNPMPIGSLPQTLSDIGTEGAVGTGAGSATGWLGKKLSGWLGDSLRYKAQPTSKLPLEDQAYIAATKAQLNDQDARAFARWNQNMQGYDPSYSEDIQLGAGPGWRTSERWSPFRRARDFVEARDPEGLNVMDRIGRDADTILAQHENQRVRWGTWKQAREVLGQMGEGQTAANRQAMSKLLTEEDSAILWDSMRKRGMSEQEASQAMKEYAYSRGVVDAFESSTLPAKNFTDITGKPAVGLAMERGQQQYAEAMIRNRQLEHEMLTATTNKSFTVPSQASGEYYDWADSLDPVNAELLKQIRANPETFLAKTSLVQNGSGAVDNEQVRRLAAQYNKNRGVISFWEKSKWPGQELGPGSYGEGTDFTKFEAAQTEYGIAKTVVDDMQKQIDDFELTPAEVFARRQKYDDYFTGNADETGMTAARSAMADSGRRMLRETLPEEWGSVMDLWSDTARLARGKSAGGISPLNFLANAEASQPESWMSPRFFVSTGGMTGSYNPYNALPDLTTPQARFLTSVGYQSPARNMARGWYETVDPAVQSFFGKTPGGGMTGGGYGAATAAISDAMGGSPSIMPEAQAETPPMQSPIGPAIAQGEFQPSPMEQRQGFTVPRNLASIDPVGIASLITGSLPIEQAQPLVAQWQDIVASGDKRKMAAYLGEISASYPKIPFAQGQVTGLPSEFELGDGVPRLFNPTDQINWEAQIKQSPLREDEKAVRVAALRKNGIVIPLDMKINSQININDENLTPNMAQLYRTYQFNKRQQTGQGSRRMF